MIIVRYADDFVVGFQYQRDAKYFIRSLKDRMEKFALQLHKYKTRLIEFGRFAMSNHRVRGMGRPQTFDFLGFTHYYTTSRKGRFVLDRKPMANRMIRTLKRIKMILRKRMHDDIKKVAKWLGQLIHGWLGYYGVAGRRLSRSLFIVSLDYGRVYCPEGHEQVISLGIVSTPL